MSGRKICFQLPDFAVVEKICAILIPKQDVELIAGDPGAMSTLPVLNHTVVDGVQRYQHSGRLQLIPQFSNIVGNNLRLGIYSGEPI